MHRPAISILFIDERQKNFTELRNLGTSEPRNFRTSESRNNKELQQFLKHAGYFCEVFFTEVNSLVIRSGFSDNTDNRFSI